MKIIESTTEKLRSLNVKTKAMVLALISGAAAVLYSGMSTTNMFGFFYLLAFYFVFKTALLITERRTVLTARVFAFVYTFFMMLNKITDFYDNKTPVTNVCRSVLYVIGFFIAFSLFLRFAFYKACQIEFKRNNGKNASFGELFIKHCIVMIICWLPYFLLVFPGNVTMDSCSQLNQAMGQEPLSNHHPVIHTAIINIVFRFGKAVFGSDMGGVAFYSAVQAVLLSCAFSYFLTKMRFMGLDKRLTNICLAFYSLIPYYGNYAVTMWKDIWFGGIMLILLTILTDIIKDSRSEKKLSKKKFWLFFIFGLLMCLFRSNGYYAFILCTPFIVLSLIRSKGGVAVMCGMCVLIISLTAFIKGPVYDSLNIMPPDPIESLSIPIQHVGRVIKEGKYIEHNQRVLISRIIDYDRISEIYRPGNSDPIKWAVRDKDNQEFLTKHKKEFFKLWFDLGKKYPLTYLRAQIDQTRGYFWPDIQYWVYGGEFRSDGFNLYRKCLLPKPLEDTFYWINDSFLYIPYLGFFRSIGLMHWLYLFAFALCFLRQGKRTAVICIPVLAVIFTLYIATPIYAEFRYAFCMFTTLPLVCVLPFLNMTKEEEKEEKDEIGETEEIEEIEEIKETEEIEEDKEDILWTTEILS